MKIHVPSLLAKDIYILYVYTHVYDYMYMYSSVCVYTCV